MYINAARREMSSKFRFQRFFAKIQQIHPSQLHAQKNRTFTYSI